MTMILTEKSGLTFLVDPMSYQYLVGAEIDYTESLHGSQFVICNPNATTTCGCGSSFSVWSRLDNKKPLVYLQEQVAFLLPKYLIFSPFK